MIKNGEMAEWFKAHAWNACIGETLSWVEHSNVRKEMLKRVKQDLIEVIRVEMEPKIEGRQAFLVVAPK